MTIIETVWALVVRVARVACLLLPLGCLAGAIGCGAAAPPPGAERPAESGTPGRLESPRTEATQGQPDKPDRPRPPLVTRNCAGLSEDERRSASDYVFRVSRFAPLSPRDASDAMQQRSIVGIDARTVGVKLYLPAERGMNRAYLERLLYCHAVTPPHLGEHPNDPLLAVGILAVEVEEAPGGEYRILILGSSRKATEEILQRARALKQRSGVVHVEQLAD